MHTQFQSSTLLQKQVIKYKKMVKETGVRVKFIAHGSYMIGENAKLHMGLWKLVVEIAKKEIYHFGPF